MRNKVWRHFATAFLAASLAVGLSGCADELDNPATPDGRPLLNDQVAAAIGYFKQANPAAASLFNSSVGYAVLPNVINFGLIIGGAGGYGEVFADGNMIGTCQLEQGSIGGQIGGQEYTEYIFFQSRLALDDFEHNEASFDARASAVAAVAGAGAAVNYQPGVIVYVKPRVGLMAQAAIGGQQFQYYPLP